MAAPRHGVGDKARGEIAAEARDVDDIRHFVAFAVHVARHHVLRLLSHKIGNRLLFVGEEADSTSKPVDEVAGLVYFTFDGVGREAFDGLGHSVLVHLLTDTHVVQRLKQQSHHTFVDRIDSINGPSGVCGAVGIGHALQQHLVVLFVCQKYFGDGFSISHMEILLESGFLRAFQGNQQGNDADEHNGYEEDE